MKFETRKASEKTAMERCGFIPCMIACFQYRLRYTFGRYLPTVLLTPMKACRARDSKATLWTSASTSNIWSTSQWCSWDKRGAMRQSLTGLLQNAEEENRKVCLSRMTDVFCQSRSLMNLRNSSLLAGWVQRNFVYLS